MFKFLKEKLSNWAKKISKEKEEAPKEIEVSKEEKKKIKEIAKKAEKEKKEKPRPEEIPEEKEPEKKGFLQRIGEKITKVIITEKEFDVYSEDGLIADNEVERLDVVTEEKRDELPHGETFFLATKDDLRSLRDDINEILGGD